MSEFAASLRDRIRQAREAVRLASEAGDEHGASAHGADLANLRRLASEHGVDVSEAGQPES
ncbi:hypothetical protein F0L68_24300 [Solihabitans fulvus]|uniref:Uncharacterized protein n=1 Tax=Solihabitans fulvus TaxID=1892852 RepID=A0A5B2X4L6_9PSEU|nr:hypothetical protein [Solihabitans fulvus]KAA2258100.1 hypothetical protein F0L68_24300 [Solihabitans fulvus]